MNTAEQFADKVADGVNNMSLVPDAFCEAMANQHRTLQQSFTRLCFAWIKYCASDEYKTDLRNESSKRACKRIMDALGEDAKYELHVPLI